MPATSDPGELAAPDETALILYTSGTTGAPKGVELTGRNLGCALHELHASIDLDEGSVCAAPVPFFHVAGLGMLLAANLNGGNLLLEQQADIAGVLRLLIDRKVTHAVLVPTVLQRLLALPECRPPTGARSATSSTGPRRSRCPCCATPPRSSAARSCSPTA